MSFGVERRELTGLVGEDQSVRRLPAHILFLVIPILAIACAVAIAVSIGLLNIWFQDLFNSRLAPVASAGGLTIIIMVVAIILAARSPKVETDEH